jgi:hypothetical protein
MTWNDVTVGQYQQLVELGKMELTEEELTHESVAVLYCMTANEVKKLAPEKLGALIGSLAFIKKEVVPVQKKRLKAGHFWYTFDTNFKELRTSKYVETKYFQQDFAGNIHNLLAVYCVPLKYNIIPYRYDIADFELHAERLKAAKLPEAMGVLLFFCPLLLNLTEGILGYSTRQLKKKERELIEKCLTLLSANTDGSIRLV